MKNTYVAQIALESIGLEYLQPNQTSTVELFYKNSFSHKKNFIVDVPMGCKYASV